MIRGGLEGRWTCCLEGAEGLSSATTCSASGGFFSSGAFLGGGGRLAGCLGRAGGDLLFGFVATPSSSWPTSSPPVGSSSFRRLGWGLLVSPGGLELIGDVMEGGLLGWGGAGGFRGAAAGGLLGGVG